MLFVHSTIVLRQTKSECSEDIGYNVNEFLKNGTSYMPQPKIKITNINCKHAIINLFDRRSVKSPLFSHGYCPTKHCH